MPIYSSIYISVKHGLQIKALAGEPRASLGHFVGATWYFLGHMIFGPLRHWHKGSILLHILWKPGNKWLSLSLFCFLSLFFSFFCSFGGLPLLPGTASSSFETTRKGQINASIRHSEIGNSGIARKTKNGEKK